MAQILSIGRLSELNGQNFHKIKLNQFVQGFCNKPNNKYVFGSVLQKPCNKLTNLHLAEIVTIGDLGSLRLPMVQNFNERKFINLL